jgi:hypothetical protein
MNVVSNTKLNKNTQVGTIANRTFCWNDRPCYRYQTCDYCWNRRVGYLMKQIDRVCTEWNLKQFVTVDVDLEDLHYKEQLLVLIKLRPKVQRELRKYSKYISVVAIKIADDLTTAHYHILTTDLDKQQFKKKMKKQIPYNTNIQFEKFYNDSVGNLKKCLFYLLLNWRESLKFKPSKKQLLSSSKGFYTGRPKNIAIKGWKL